jgi:hypothetical protein
LVVFPALQVPGPPGGEGEDAEVRATIIESLRDKLTQRDKKLVGIDLYWKHPENLGVHYVGFYEEKIQHEK